MTSLKRLIACQNRRSAKRIHLLTLLILFATAHLAQSQVKINEICAANGDVIYDPDFFNFPAWVELYNSGDTPADISGYYLSDLASNPTLWAIPANTIIPAKSYLVIWCDNENVGLHSVFSLDADGEEVLLSDPSANVIDQIAYPKQPATNIAFGRLTDGGSEITFLVDPTPGAPNISQSGDAVLETPVMSMKAGKYAGPVSVAITHPLGNVTLRYTLDGSQPDKSSPLYSGPIDITTTKTLKARAYADGFLPSKTEVKTYFINEHEFSLKVVSVSIDPKYLNDDKIGIYVVGSNGATGRGSDVPVNWNQAWWRHGDIEFFSKTGEKLFDKSVDIQIAGNYSRLKPQKSFEIKSRDKYGKSFFTEKLFPNKKHIDKVKGFYLRNSGTEWNITHFRDALTQYSTFGKMDLDFQDYDPYTVYLNGAYWGILNLREKNSENFIESNYGLMEGEFDLLEKEGRVNSGSADKYEAYLDSLTKVVDLENPASIAFLERHIDVQNYINYYTTNIFYSCTDWPHNNVKYWAPKNGRFRWFLYDMDYSMNHGTNTSTPTHASLPVATDPNHPRGNWVTENLRNALRNPIFKKRFISTMYTALETTFTDERIQPIVTRFRDGIEEEMPYHMQKWDGSVAQWENRIQQMRSFVVPRITFLRQHYQEFFDLEDPLKVSVTLSPEIGGRFELNGQIHSKTLINSSSFAGLPVTFKASPKPGYRFKHLNVTRRGHKTEALIASKSLWAYFDKGTLPAENWTSVGYDDAAWATGNAELGYGESDQATQVGYGPSSSNKYIVTYFRKSFSVDLSAVGDIYGSVKLDDGAVVYINGAEVARFNLPEGAVTNSTLANDGAENLWRSFSIDKDLLINGTNVIAVSIHQNAYNSSDMSFDFKLMMEKLLPMEQVTLTSPTLDDIAFSDYSIEAVFEQINGIVINEVSASNSQVPDEAGEAEDWIELHNAGPNAVDIGGFFITDDPENKSKFQIPSGSGPTILQPGSYLLLWADEQTWQGATHLSFKLSQEGEYLGLYMKEGEAFVLLDELTYGEQQNNQSWARVPNAYGDFGLTSYTTPSEENNTILSVAEERTIFSAYPNPTDGILNLTFASHTNNVRLIDMYGRTLHHAEIRSGEATIDLSGVRPGVYVVKVENGDRSAFLRVIRK
jgi:hypothetical protein